MSALLPHRPPRWTWPVAWSTAALLVLAALLVPESWWWLLVPDRDLGRHAASEVPTVLELMDLEIQFPPPEVVVTPEPDTLKRPEPEPHVDPDWWTHSWNARIVADMAPAQTLPDSLLPSPLLDILGARATVELVLMQPDSLVQARIWWLAKEERYTRDDVDGLFSAIARARAYADMKQREAAMFDEFINETVPVSR